MVITTFLFDLDGTLMDSDALHHHAFNTTSARWDRSISVDDDKSHIMGHTNASTFSYLFPGMPA